MHLGSRKSNITHNFGNKCNSKINLEKKLFGYSMRVDKNFVDFDNNIDDDSDLNSDPIIDEEPFPNISKLQPDVAKSEDSSHSVHPRIHQCTVLHCILIDFELITFLTALYFILTFACLAGSVNLSIQVSSEAAAWRCSSKNLC